MRNRYLIVVSALALLVGVFALAGVVSANSGNAGAGTPDKQTLLQQRDAATATADARSPRAPKDSNNAAVQPKPCPQQFQPGVYTFHIAPDDVLHTYHIVNAATAVTASGDAYTILAGSLLSDSSQGVLLVEQLVVDPCTTSTRYPTVPYPTPTKQGAITLTGVGGTAVTFVTATGKPGQFAYATGTFLA